MMNYSMLDLGAGLGGGSESMLNNGWDVQRVDKNPLLSAVPNMTIRNINQLADELEKHISEGNYPHSPTLVWHSPDCTEFSRGFNAPGPKAQREGKKFIPDLQQMQTGKFIIDTLRPQWWIIENVVGAIPWFAPDLGEPRLKIGPFVFWGNFPIFEADIGDHSKTNCSAWSTDPLRSNKRAIIPYAISDALRQSIEAQKTLDYWL